MWWMDLVFGFWNGITAWIVFIVHVFGGWSEFPLYDVARSGGWYDLGFLIGAGSSLLGAGSTRAAAQSSDRALPRVLKPSTE
jgi:hypothetical protein